MRSLGLALLAVACSADPDTLFSPVPSAPMHALGGAPAVKPAPTASAPKPPEPPQVGGAAGAPEEAPAQAGAGGAPTPEQPPSVPAGGVSPAPPLPPTGTAGAPPATPPEPEPEPPRCYKPAECVGPGYLHVSRPTLALPLHPKSNCIYRESVCYPTGTAEPPQACWHVDAPLCF